MFLSWFSEILVCCSTYLCIHWLIFVCALTRDQTHNLGILRWGSNQLDYLARAEKFLMLIKRLWMVLKTFLFALTLVFQPFADLWSGNNVEYPLCFVLVEILQRFLQSLRPVCCTNHFLSLFSFLDVRNIRVWQNRPSAVAVDERWLVFWGSK